MSDNSNNENWKTVEKIALNVERMLRDITNMHRDIIILRDRIIPFDDEVRPPRVQFEPVRHVNLKSALERIEDIQEYLFQLGFDIGKIRSAMDTIVSDAVLRSDMKPYLIDPKPRNRRQKDQG